MSADSNTNPFGDPLKDPDTEQVADSAPSVTYLTVVLLMVFGLVLGVFATLGIQHITAPLPQALVAQVGTGTILTPPTSCATDHIYQVAINGGDAKEVVDGKLVPGDMSVTATAKFSEAGTADTLVVAAKPYDDKAPQPVFTWVFAWKAPVASTPNTQLAYQVVRYAVPPNAWKLELLPTKVAFSRGTILFACVSTEPN